MNSQETYGNGTKTNLPRLRPVQEWIDLAQERAQNLKTAPGLRFGISKLDNAIHGLPMGKISILAARPSEGKTSFALQIAMFNALNDIPVSFVSLEDDAASLAERIICNEYKRQIWDLRQSGNYSEFKINSPILLIDQYGFLIEELEYITTLNPKPKLIVLDYIQLINLTGKQTEYDAISQFSQKLKKLAERTQTAFLVLSQINRQGAKDGSPELHHLANCGRLEQVADLVLIMYSPYFYGQPSFDKTMQECPKDYTEIEVAKNKLGMRNCIAQLRFIGAQYRFIEWGATDDRAVNL